MIAFSKNDKMREEVAQKKIELKHFFIFFSKYVIFKFHHFLGKVAPVGDVDNGKKKSNTTPLKMGLNDEKQF